MQSWMIGEAKIKMLEEMYETPHMMPKIMVNQYPGARMWGALSSFPCIDPELDKERLRCMSIKRSQWLTQHIIDAYAMVLNKSRLENQENPDVLCTACASFGKDPSNKIRKSNSYDIDGVVDLLIPCVMSAEPSKEERG